MFDLLLSYLTLEQVYLIVIAPFAQSTANTDHSIKALNQRPATISELDLLKRLIPKELYQNLSQLGLQGLQAMNFVLRHQVQRLHCKFHTVKLNESSHVEVLHDWENRFGSENLPLFGFSPIGIHYALRKRGLCRAFDAYAITACQQSAQPIFCPKHAGEAWWQNTAQASNQAIMYAFYAKIENFSLYSEQELHELSQTFWRKYLNYKIPEANQVSEAMLAFKIADQMELKNLGVSGLKQKFLQLAMMHHPDLGGQHEAFITIQAHYKILEETFHSQAHRD